MSFDAHVKVKKPIICPCCGTVAGYELLSETDLSGNTWRPLREILQYPDEMYGKEMKLSAEQVKDLTQYCFIGLDYLRTRWYSRDAELLGSIAAATELGYAIFFSADW